MKIWLYSLLLSMYGTALAKGTSMEKPFTLTSPAFSHNGMIPKPYTCSGENISPELRWSNPPKGTKSFALIVDDPDAPTKRWVHWILFNIPASECSLSRGIERGSFTSGKTDFTYMKKNVWQYCGPCPPSGTHRYFFTLYALDTKLNITQQATREDLLRTMEGHVLGKAELIGFYTLEKKK